ncbi:hypothetical protein PG911_06345 [Tenacibaculum ovolyticum]|uniref:hypothetical protein n=1 Tax=Tenacibaculum ovolyticum TaxID=104270 RepID=UPI0022F3DB61|nr:hypothetical protein [Tenacibaculum ovolyticum]WBX77870.1 hypothetical protein PG911_06345 [Tenacibaculum ovolyticum]
MFGKIIEKIDKQFLHKIDSEAFPLIIKELINLLFDGNYEKVNEKLEELEKTSLNDEEIVYGFICQFPILELFKEISGVIKNSSNITDLINQVCYNEENIISIFQRVPKEQLLKLVNIYDENIESIKSFFTDIFNLGEFEKREITRIFFKTTKQEIADEFNVNKRTFNKWLKEIFGNRFDNQRVIFIHEYIEIFNALVDENKEYLELTDFNKIKGRLDEGTSYDKKRIAYLTNEGTDKDSSTLLKTQKENLEDIKFYKKLDKFPYSLTKIIIDRLGDELEF